MSQIQLSFDKTLIKMFYVDMLHDFADEGAGLGNFTGDFELDRFIIKKSLHSVFNSTIFTQDDNLDTFDTEVKNKIINKGIKETVENWISQSKTILYDLCKQQGKYFYSEPYIENDDVLINRIETIEEQDNSLLLSQYDADWAALQAGQYYSDITDVMGEFIENSKKFTKPVYIIEDAMRTKSTIPLLWSLNYNTNIRLFPSRQVIPLQTIAGHYDEANSKLKIPELIEKNRFFGCQDIFDVDRNVTFQVNNLFKIKMIKDEKLHNNKSYVLLIFLNALRYLKQKVNYSDFIKVMKLLYNNKFSRVYDIINIDNTYFTEFKNIPTNRDALEQIGSSQITINDLIILFEELYYKTDTTTEKNPTTITTMFRNIFKNEQLSMKQTSVYELINNLKHDPAFLTKLYTYINEEYKYKLILDNTASSNLKLPKDILNKLKLIECTISNYKGNSENNDNKKVRQIASMCNLFNFITCSHDGKKPKKGNPVLKIENEILDKIIENYQQELPDDDRWIQIIKMIIHFDIVDFPLDFSGEKNITFKNKYNSQQCGSECVNDTSCTGYEVNSDNICKSYYNMSVVPKRTGPNNYKCSTRNAILINNVNHNEFDNTICYNPNTLLNYMFNYCILKFQDINTKINLHFYDNNNQGIYEHDKKPTPVMCGKLAREEIYNVFNKTTQKAKLAETKKRTRDEKLNKDILTFFQNNKSKIYASSNINFTLIFFKLFSKTFGDFSQIALSHYLNKDPSCHASNLSLPVWFFSFDDMATILALYYGTNVMKQGGSSEDGGISYGFANTFGFPDANVISLKNKNEFQNKICIKSNNFDYSARNYPNEWNQKQVGGAAVKKTKRKKKYRTLKKRQYKRKKKTQKRKSKYRIH